MLAGAMGASIAVYSQEVYSGTYTVSSAPAQQSRLCVVDANTPSDCQTNCFETRSFFRGVLALLGGLSVTYYHNLASLHSAGRGPLETFETVFDAHACYPWRVTVCSGQLSAPPATVMKTAVDRFSATNTIGISSCCNLQCAFVIRTPCFCLGPQCCSSNIMLDAGSASGVFAARYAGFIKGTTAGTVTWNVGSSYT